MASIGCKSGGHDSGDFLVHFVASVVCAFCKVSCLRVSAEKLVCGSYELSSTQAPTDDKASSRSVRVSTSCVSEEGKECIFFAILTFFCAEQSEEFAKMTQSCSRARFYN